MSIFSTSGQGGVKEKDMVQEAIRDQVEKYFDKVRTLADHLTEHPEISGEEKESCAYITDFLKELGYEITAPYAGMPHSFLAVDREKKDFKGPKAAFICEYDALPDVLADHLTEHPEARHIHI